MAEEAILAQIFREPALLEDCKHLRGSDFSVPLLGNVYGQMLSRHRQGLEVSLAVLEELSSEEMSHLSGICQRQQGPVSESGFRDCVNIILAQRQSATVSSDDDLLALRNKLKERKGTNG